MGRATVVLVLALPLGARRHCTSDVVAGAAIGIGMNHAHRGRAHREGLLPRHHEVEEDPAWGATFRDPTAVQPPRVVRLGARFDS